MSPAAKMPGNRRHVVVIGSDVASYVERDSGVFDHAITHRATEAHCDQNKFGRDREVCPGNGFEFRRRSDARRMEMTYISNGVAAERCRRHTPDPLSTFFVRGLDAKLHWP